MIDAVIIGGGISGLACAHELKFMGRKVVVLESHSKLGGSARSKRFGGFLMEHGPSTVSAASEVVIDFSRQLQLEGLRRDLGLGVKRRYMVSGGALQGVSAGPLGFLLSSYLSIGARLRLMLEFSIPAAIGKDDETVADFCRRRFGHEFMERVIDPLVAGIYAGRADELSINAVFPKLVEMERKYGAVSPGLMRLRKHGVKMPSSRLFSWQDGIESLPAALAAAMDGDVSMGIAAHRLKALSGGFKVETRQGGDLTARSLVIATQPNVAAQLLEGLDGDAAAAAGGIDAPPMAVVFFGFKRQQVDHPLDGLGFLSSSQEGRALNGAQFCSTMFPGRAPDGHVSVAGYMGGARSPELAKLPREALADLALLEFRGLIGVKGQPVVTQVKHWPLGLPQYRIGHQERIDRLNGLRRLYPGLFLTGNYFHGPSVAACLGMARDTARMVNGFLLSRRGVSGH